MLNYKGLTATKEILHVSDEHVDQQISRLLERQFKNIVITDRPSQLDDEVVLDYAGFLGDTQFEGGTAEKQTLVLGSGMFIPGFEEQLVGKNPGDEVDVHVTFPQQYHAADLAGQAVVFKCKIHEIRIKKKYEADDEFAREVGGCESFTAFRDALRASIQDYMDSQSDAEVKDNLLSQLCASCEYEITAEQLEKAIDMEIQTLEAQLARQGLNIDLYCQFTGKSRDDLREEYTVDAKKNILRQNIISEIAGAEKIEATEADVAEEVSRICKENNMTIEQLQPYYTEEFQNAIVRAIITNKVLDKLVEYAEITIEEKNS